ncbi:MAG: GNAT family N-acetyltransferase [Pseudomonadota bacterium]
MTDRQRCTQAPQGAAAAAAVRHRAALPALETPRLRLRVPVMADLPLWTRIFASEEATQFGGPFDAEEAWANFSTYVAGWLLHGHGLWSVERRSDGALIGFVHLGLEWGDAEPELGWMFAPEARGQGYAAEAASAARDFGFDLLDTFVSCIDQTNAPSARLAARLGAVPDASPYAGVNVWRHGRLG